MSTGDSVRAAIAVLIAVVAFITGIYVGVVELFIGGIVQFIEGVKATPVDAGDIAWGIAKVFVLAETVGFLIAFAGIGVASLIYPHDSPPWKKRRSVRW